MKCSCAAVLVVFLFLETLLVAQDVVDDGLPRKLVAAGLPNPVLIHPKVISGGLPEGEAAFRELALLGVKTIISVDGMRPDVSTAKMHGMRYVHLPHGYDGIPPQRLKELAKAVRELDGPIYIHCHHGKHRSPAAAAAACVAAGLIPTSNALPILQLAGTSENYRGLYQSAEQSVAFNTETLDSLHVDFHETVQVPPLADAMVALDNTYENLKLIAVAGWKAPPNHPDLDPSHEALLLHEHFAELLRVEEVAGEPSLFQAMLGESVTAAKQLREALEQPNAERSFSARERISKDLTRIGNSCSTCHQRFRDVPLREKPRQ